MCDSCAKTRFFPDRRTIAGQSRRKTRKYAVKVAIKSLFWTFSNCILQLFGPNIYPKLQQKSSLKNGFIPVTKLIFGHFVGFKFASRNNMIDENNRPVGRPIPRNHFYSVFCSRHLKGRRSDDIWGINPNRKGLPSTEGSACLGIPSQSSQAQPQSFLVVKSDARCIRMVAK